MVYTFARIGAALKMTIEDDGTVKAADGRTHNVNWRVTGQTGEHGMAHLVRMVHA
jgi:VCBS repeat-containing protein